jgi:hypothetical protein
MRRATRESDIFRILSRLLDTLEGVGTRRMPVIDWACPVPSFGDVTHAHVATLGLNPSNREFVDGAGKELDGTVRRFHTLRSLKLAAWAGAEQRHKRMIWESCRDYFDRNPYDGWFRQLDHLLQGTSSSFYENGGACHLDLVPFATACKWTALSSHQRRHLVNSTSNILIDLLRHSEIALLILNGATVIRHFEMATGASLSISRMPDWTLRRGSGEPVVGYGYSGVMRAIRGASLGRKVRVLGFNHNIQSSFGVTTAVRASIRSWIARAAGVAT